MKTRIRINTHDVEVQEGTTLLEAAQQAGIHIPTLCHHPRFPAQATCRLCLVQVQGQGQAATQLRPACATPARAGDEVTTDAPGLVAFRRTDLAWLLARHPNDCMRCEVQGQCRLQQQVGEMQVQEQWDKLARADGDAAGHGSPVRRQERSPSISREMDKCIECGLCVQACGDAGQQQHVIGFTGRGGERLPVTVFERPLADTPCISCGQCTVVCPTGALAETPDWHEVLAMLDAGRRTSVVQVAPATRVAISEEFGMPPGTVSTGRMINALRRLGFHYVFDTNFAADLTVMEEATELIGRLREGGALPLFTSCCPAWIHWLEINRPDLLPHLSTAKSPQLMHGALSKRGPFARGLMGGSEDPAREPCVVSIMPCTAKKDEVLRPGVQGDVDHVLTTRELARLMRARGIALMACDEDGRFDDPLGASTGAAQIFAASGGVMEAVARTASHLLGAGGADGAGPLEWHALRGVGPSVKTLVLPGVGQVAVCNGIAAAQDLLRDDAWRRQFVAIEVMSCVGGCLGGGGEPKSGDPQVLEKRAHAIYALDAQALQRRSYENPSVQALYRDELGRPGSPQAHRLLHTGFSGRHTPRAMLMQFLDAVDRRDEQALRRLVHPGAQWETASAFGRLEGLEDIVAMVTGKLGPARAGPGLERHRMLCPSDPGDLRVVTHAGETCGFTLELEASEPGRPPGRRITRLVRTPADGGARPAVQDADAR